jgi:Holliday junction resolvase RusA-like endonuclease
MMIEFHVHGVPAPQGSKRGVVNKFTQRVAMIESSKKVAPWRSDVARAAEAQMFLQLIKAPFSGPLRVKIEFDFLRPATHQSARGGLRASAPMLHSKRPDIDKLVRSTFDALSKRLWLDDAQVCELHVVKQYGATTGAHIVVEEL